MLINIEYLGTDGQVHIATAEVYESSEAEVHCSVQRHGEAAGTAPGEGQSDPAHCGDSPLIVHAWSEKAKKEMLQAQQGKKLLKKEKVAKNPDGECAEALYWLNGRLKR